ncbi:hypothetical protein ABPG75_001479 [Micractinium tetrahymenae]
MAAAAMLWQARAGPRSPCLSVFRHHCRPRLAFTHLASMGRPSSPLGLGPGWALLASLLLLSSPAARADLITNGVEELAGAVALQGSVRRRRRCRHAGCLVMPPATAALQAALQPPRSSPTQQGIKLVLNPSQPKLTVLGLSAACPDGASNGCDGQFLMQAVKDVYEVDASGARVANRSAGDVLNTSQGAWETTAVADLSSYTTPPVNASTAAFTAPFKPALPACPAGPGALSQPLPSEGSFTFRVLLFSNDTNFTAAPGQEAVEVLAGNVKTALDISHWPFCASGHSLVVELALKSTKLGAADAPRQPLVRSGAEAEQEADELAQQLFDAMGAAPEDGGGEPR